MNSTNTSCISLRKMAEDIMKLSFLDDLAVCDIVLYLVSNNAIHILIYDTETL